MGGSAHGISTQLKPLSLNGLSVEDSMKNQNGDGSRHPLDVADECSGNYPITLSPFCPQRQASCNFDATHGAQGGLGTDNPFPPNQRTIPALHTREIPKGIISIVKPGKGNPGHQTDQDHASQKLQLDQESYFVNDPHSAVTIAMPSSNPRASIRAPGHRSANPECNSDQLRNARISRAVNALYGLVPNPLKSNRAFILDEIIEYVKFLQLQMKVLCMRRLGGEAVVDHLLHLEGYGHFLPNQQQVQGSLDEMIGNLMDSDMLVAIQLLETKGLHFVPISLVEDHASQKHQSDQEGIIVNERHPTAISAIASSKRKPSRTAPGHQSANPDHNSDRLRNGRISRALKALHGLVPNSRKRNRAFIVDEIIEYVKFLQLQMKVLSMTRPSGKALVDHLLHFEGHGNFQSNQQPLQESLDEMIGNLMDSDMMAAIQLLESKGLCFMPISSVDSYAQT